MCAKQKTIILERTLPQHHIIVGNGPAGIAAASKIRTLDRNTIITLISADTAAYYAKPRLPEYIAGKIEADQLIIYPPEWYETQRITQQLNSRVIAINRQNQVIETTTNKLSYDRLLLALGATPVIPTLLAHPQNGIFTLRTLTDALALKQAINGISKIIVIGGGLLGLEIANSFVAKNRTINLIEYFPTLLPRQLSQDKGKALQLLLENRGFKFHLSESCAKLDGTNGDFCITTVNNTRIFGEIIVICSGVKATIELATQANLTCDKGLIVNHLLQTNDPIIYAAGDCIQLNGKTWGFVKSAIEQGSIAGENMVLGNVKEYTDTSIEVSLKVSGINLNLL